MCAGQERVSEIAGGNVCAASHRVPVLSRAALSVQEVVDTAAHPGLPGFGVHQRGVAPGDGGRQVHFTQLLVFQSPAERDGDGTTEAEFNQNISSNINYDKSEGCSFITKSIGTLGEDGFNRGYGEKLFFL